MTRFSSFLIIISGLKRGKKRKGGREGRRERGREGGREGERTGRREGEREGEREEGREGPQRRQQGSNVVVTVYVQQDLTFPQTSPERELRCVLQMLPGSGDQTGALEE